MTKVNILNININILNYIRKEKTRVEKWTKDINR